MPCSNFSIFRKAADPVISLVGDLAPVLAEAELKGLDAGGLELTSEEDELQWFEDMTLITGLEKASKGIKVSFDAVDLDLARGLLRGVFRTTHLRLLLTTEQSISSNLGLIACHSMAAATVHGIRGLRRSMMILHELRMLARDIALIRPLDDLDLAVHHCRGVRQARQAFHEILGPFAGSSSLAAWILHGVTSPVGGNVGIHVSGFRAEEFVA